MDEPGMPSDVGGRPERTRRNKMTDQTLAQLSNLAIYSAVVVLTLAMLADAVYLARLVPAREAARETSRERELVTAGGTTETADPASKAADPASTATPTGRGAEPVAARKAAAIGWMLTLLGTFFVVAGVALRALEVHRWPLGNMYEFAVFGSMFVLLAYCGWSMRRDLRWLGLFVVVPVLLNLGLAITVWYTDAAELVPSLRSVWLAIHVTVATLSVAVFTIGFSLGVMYLIQDRLETAEHRPRSFMDRLPNARALERLTYAVHIVAFPLWTFAVIAGAIWGRQAWGSYWNWDPKEVWSFVIWVVYAAYLHARATTGWKRQNAAWIALVGYGCIILNFAVVNVFFVGQHSYSGL
jgi:cytochrome c-type biogenesis protein CcsB